jgi:hypothetical protein
MNEHMREGSLMWKISKKSVGKLGGCVTASAALAAMACIATPPAATAQTTPVLQVLCQVLDETGQFEKTEFEGGETAILRLLIIVPEEAYKEKINVRTEARAKIRGFRYKVDLPVAYITVPKKSDRLTINGYTPDLQEFTPFRQLDTFNDVDVDARVAVKLPNHIPDTDITLRAIGYIPGYAKQSCEKEIELNN